MNAILRWAAGDVLLRVLADDGTQIDTTTAAGARARRRGLRGAL